MPLKIIFRNWVCVITAWLNDLTRWLGCLILVLVLFGLGQVAPVLAQDLPIESLSGESAPGTGSASLDSDGISPEKISQFVRAYLRVLELIERREGDLQASETDSESLRIQQDIETEAYKIIEQMGLTRQEYLQLLSLANTDPEFGERVAAQLQEGIH